VCVVREIKRINLRGMYGEDEQSKHARVSAIITKNEAMMTARTDEKTNKG